MARVRYQSPISHISGALEKFGVVTRFKQFRNDKGTIVHQGKSEAYSIKRPRDYKKNPPTGAELAHLQLFGEAAHRTTALLKIVQQCNATLISPDDVAAVQELITHYPEHAQNLQTYFDYKTRYLKQLQRTADPEAPADRTGERRRYYRLDNFIRAMIYKNLKAGQS